MCFPVLRARLVPVLLAKAVGAVFDLLHHVLKILLVSSETTGVELW